jgi:AraC-like DNA-binding protein
MSLASPKNGLIRPWENGRSFELRPIAPPPALRRLVEQHWVVSWELGQRSFTQEILPHPSLNLVVEANGAFVWGVPTRRGTRVLTGRGWAIGTKLRPGAFTALTGIAASSITNDRIAVEEAFGSEQRLPLVSSPERVIASVHALLAPAAGVEDPDFDLVVEVIERMRELSPHARVDEIARLHGLSARHLQRLFRRYVGVSPKWVLKRLRIHDAVASLSGGQPSSAARLALDLGYYDQAHFIRDFRLVVGRSPAQYVAEARAATRVG